MAAARVRVRQRGRKGASSAEGMHVGESRTRVCRGETLQSGDGGALAFHAKLSGKAGYKLAGLSHKIPYSAVVDGKGELRTKMV